MTTPAVPLVRLPTVRILAFACTFVVGLATAPVSAWAQATTDQASKASSPAEQPNGHSNFRNSMSLLAAKVAFASYASNLVAGDDNGSEDVFVFDLDAGTMTRASAAAISGNGNGSSTAPSISYPGNFVAFHSNASNLVPDDSNNTTDVFVRDLRDSDTYLISVNSDGEQGNDVSYFASISGTGQFVAFTSYASNLVDGDSNGVSDVFVREPWYERTTIASAGGDGRSWDAAISGDGRYVAFTSYGENFVFGPGNPAPPIDTNGFPDVYVYDQLTGGHDLVSVRSDGALGNGWSHAPAISKQGRFVAFMSSASNLVEGDDNGARDVFVRDRETGTTERVGEYVDNFEGLGRLSISEDGRYVAFPSYGSDLVAGDTNGVTDVFVHDRWTGVTERVSRSSDGSEGQGASMFPSLGPGGTSVAFASQAENLVPTDSNGLSDIFVRSQWPTEVVFADIFENGSFSAWSSTAGFDEVCLSHFNGGGRAEGLATVSGLNLHGTYVGKFVPETYPFRPTRVEIGFAREGLDYSWLDYEVVFFDDDGPDGAPGTPLGSVPASAYWINHHPWPYAVPVMVGGVVPQVTDGAVYIGARWFGPTAGGIGICTDEELFSPNEQATYFKADGVANWNEVAYELFNALFITACGH